MNAYFTEIALARLSELEALVRDNQVDAPLVWMELQSLGFASCRALFEGLVGLDRSAVLAVLGAVIAERTRNQATRNELVWTGPVGAQARSTRAVVEELLQRAQHEVLVAGYAFYEAEDIFAPLAERMRRHAVASEFYIHVGEKAQSAAAFWKFTWPWRDVLPVVYHDPQTAEGRVSMHAKCVVVDARFSFITSANFTSRAQSENVEVGVVIEDAAFATQLVAQWRALRRTGRFRELKL